MRAIHPGEIFREEVLIPLNMTASNLARVIGVSASRVPAVVREGGPVTAEKIESRARASPWERNLVVVEMRTGHVSPGQSALKGVHEFQQTPSTVRRS